MGHRTPHPINCLAQNNCCSKSIDCDAKQWRNGNGKNVPLNDYRIQIAGIATKCKGIASIVGHRRQCISWKNFCRSIRLCAFALFLLNADVIAAEPQQIQHQQPPPCEARILEELPPDPVSLLTKSTNVFIFCAFFN